MNICLEVLNMPDTKQAEHFGSILKSKRLARGLTQDQLVERCGNLLSKSYLSLLEKGRTRKKDGMPVKPAPAIVDALAEALGESKNEFRQLTGNLPVDAGLSRDQVGDEFTFSLERFRKLSDRGQRFAREQIKSTIDFLLEVEGEPGSAGNDPTLDRSAANDEVSRLPEISLEDAKRHSEKKRNGEE